MANEQRYAFEDITSLCVTLCQVHSNWYHRGGTPLLTTVCYLQLTGPIGRSARNFAALVFRPESNHTDMNNLSATQTPDSRVIGMCSHVDWAAVEGSYVNYWNPSSCHIQSEVNSHYWGTSDCSLMNAFMACLKYLLSDYGELKFVTFILAKFSWGLKVKAHFLSRWHAFYGSFADSLFPSSEFQIFLFSWNWHNREYCSNRMSQII